MIQNDKVKSTIAPISKNHSNTSTGLEPTPSSAALFALRIALTPLGCHAASSLSVRAWLALAPQCDVESEQPLIVYQVEASPSEKAFRRAIDRRKTPVTAKIGNFHVNGSAKGASTAEV